MRRDKGTRRGVEGFVVIGANRVHNASHANRVINNGKHGERGTCGSWRADKQRRSRSWEGSARSQRGVVAGRREFYT